MGLHIVAEIQRGLVMLEAFNVCPKLHVGFVEIDGLGIKR